MPRLHKIDSDKEEEDYILKTAAPDMINEIVNEMKQSMIKTQRLRKESKRLDLLIAERLAKEREEAEKKKKDDSSDDEEPEKKKEDTNEEKMQKKHHKYKYMGKTRDQAIQMFENAQKKLNGTRNVKKKNIIYNDIYELNRYVEGLDGYISKDESDEVIEKKKDITERMLAKNNPYLFYNFTTQGLNDIIKNAKRERDEIRYITPESIKKKDHLNETIKEARRTLNAFKGDISDDEEPVKKISMSITHKKADKRAPLKADSESERNSDDEVTHEFFEIIEPEMRLDMKTINKYYMSKTPEIKVPNKVIDVDNRGHLSLVNTLDSHGDINKVDGHKVLNVISYVPDSVKDSKIKVKQGNHSDLSKEVKKVEGKLKRSKKPTTIAKLNNELDELLKKLS